MSELAKSHIIHFLQIVCTKLYAYCYDSVSIISLALSQIDHIKRRLLQLMKLLPFFLWSILWQGSSKQWRSRIRTSWTLHRWFCPRCQLQSGININWLIPTTNELIDRTIKRGVLLLSKYLNAYSSSFLIMISFQNWHKRK